MSMLNIIAGPLIGAVIGYFTNYIAVKMLFRPLKPIKIGKFTLPFTPGIIPKRKGELGKAIGAAVGHNLFTSDDLINTFTSDDIKNAVSDKIIGCISDNAALDGKSIISGLTGIEKYDAVKSSVQTAVSEKITNALTSLNLGEIIANEAANAVKEKARGTMFALMVNDKLISTFTEPMSERINDYIDQNANDIVSQFVADELNDLEKRSLSDLLGTFDISYSSIRSIASKVYDRAVSENLGSIIKQIDIAAIVEEKIDAMDVMEIEKLTLSVMKHELDEIVNLGALIGFIIGILNIFI